MAVIEGKTLGFFVLGFIVITLGIVVIQYIGEVSTEVGYDSVTNTSSFVNNQISPTIYPVSDRFSTATSMSKLNRTWIDFDGTQNVEVIDSTIYNQTLISFNFKTTGNSMNLLEKRGVWNVFINGSGTVGFIIFYNNSNSTYNFTQMWNANVSDGNWHWVLAYQEGTFLKISVDDITAQSKTSNKTMNPYTTPITIGGGSIFANNYTGSIDNIRVQNETKPDNLARYRAIIYNETLLEPGIRVPVIMMHSAVSFSDVSYTQNFTFFQDQLEYLNESGFSMYKLIDYYDWTQGTINLAKKPIVYTSDDGRLEEVNVSRELNRYGYNASFAIVTSFISQNSTLYNASDTRYYMNWSMVRQLIADGMEICSHTVTHQNMSAVNYSLRQQQFLNSKNDIIQNTSYTPRCFIFPDNAQNSTLQQECLQYYDVCTAGVTTNKWIYMYRDYNEALGVNRISVTNATAWRTFTEYVNPEEDMKLLYNLNENFGTIAYDSSDLSSNTTLDGFTWENDGISRSVPSYDYTSTPQGVVTILSPEHLYRYLTYGFGVYVADESNGAALTMLELGAIMVALVILIYLFIHIKEEYDLW